MVGADLEFCEGCRGKIGYGFISGGGQASEEPMPCRERGNLKFFLPSSERRGVYRNAQKLPKRVFKSSNASLIMKIINRLGLLRLVFTNGW